MPAFQPQSSTNNMQHRLLEHHNGNNATHSVYGEQQENKGLMQHDQFNQNQGFKNSIDQNLYIGRHNVSNPNSTHFGNNTPCGNTQQILVEDGPY